MHATLEGLREFLGAAADGWFNGHPDADRLISNAEARIAAYIVPNTPRCSDQAQAFEAAVYAQVEFETDPANAQIASMPGGLSSFSVNGFSAAFRENGSGTMFPCGVSARAKSELLLAGLLYRGVSVC